MDPKTFKQPSHVTLIQPPYDWAKHPWEEKITDPIDSPIEQMSIPRELVEIAKGVGSLAVNMPAHLLETIDKSHHAKKWPMKAGACVLEFVSSIIEITRDPKSQTDEEPDDEQPKPHKPPVLRLIRSAKD